LHIEALEIDDYILEKIKSKHGVTFEEAEEACLSEGRHVRCGKEGLYKVFNQIFGRYLLVVLANKGNGIWQIVTAREMSSSEKKLYDKVMGR
jgi:uncharacterized DUF497 family protein